MPRRKKDLEPEDRDDFAEVVHGEYLETLEDFVRALATSFSKNLRFE